MARTQSLLKWTATAAVGLCIALALAVPSADAQRRLRADIFITQGFCEAFEPHLFARITPRLASLFRKHLKFIVEYNGHHLGAAEVKANPDSALR